MPHLLCPGFLRCNRHYTTPSGLKGHVVTCKYASKYKLIRSDQKELIGMQLIYIYIYIYMYICIYIYICMCVYMNLLKLVYV